MKTYHSSFFFMLVINSLFFRAEAMPPTEPREESSSPIVGTWETIDHKAENFGILKKLVTYEQKGNYSVDPGINLTEIPPCVRILVASKILIRGIKNEQIIYPFV